MARTNTPKISVAISQPSREWVAVRCPKIRFNGLEIKKNSRPIVEVGWSISGIIAPKTEATKIVQCKLQGIPNMARMIRVSEMPKILWVGANNFAPFSR